MKFGLVHHWKLKSGGVFLWVSKRMLRQKQDDLPLR